MLVVDYLSHRHSPSSPYSPFSSIHTCAALSPSPKTKSNVSKIPVWQFLTSHFLSLFVLPRLLPLYSSPLPTLLLLVFFAFPRLEGRAIRVPPHPPPLVSSLHTFVRKKKGTTHPFTHTLFNTRFQPFLYPFHSFLMGVQAASEPMDTRKAPTTINFIFLSCHFPPRFRFFVQRMKAKGVNVLGIGDESYGILWKKRKRKVGREEM